MTENLNKVKKQGQKIAPVFYNSTSSLSQAFQTVRLHNLLYYFICRGVDQIEKYSIFEF